ncbi:MAG TPA: 5-formyltetrahydrofolate cyclo-ligase [Candidatus Binataceae bacterium]|nr:5-formyltetrahydrofolate cyclo-ligase [Candidatus Binataceae bacterium]
MADDKKYLRKILRECRSALPRAYVASASGAVQRRLMASAAYRDADAVVLYAAKDNEIATGELLAGVLASGRLALMPKVVLDSHDLRLIRVNDPSELAPGAFGLLEPTGAEIVPLAGLVRALICVPGVAFSPVGQRLGRGGGYYDRMLAATGPQVITAGLAYSFQLLDRLPESPNDRRLNLIVTESAMHAAGDAPHPGTLRADQGGVPRCW